MTPKCLLLLLFNLLTKRRIRLFILLRFTNALIVGLSSPPGRHSEATCGGTGPVVFQLLQPTQPCL